MTKSEMLQPPTIPSPDILPETRFSQELVSIDDNFRGGEQRFSTSFTPGDGSRSGELVVVSTAFLDGPHTPMQSLRARLYSHETGLDVVSVGVPGMAASELDLSIGEADQYTLTSKQREALADGDFTVLGVALWTAVRKNLSRNGILPDELKSRKIHMLNYSLGVSTSAGILEAAEEFATNPGRIINLEGVAYEPSTRRERLGAFVAKSEQVANARYESANPEWVPKTTDTKALLRLMGNIANYPLVHFSTGTALARGTLTDQLLKGLQALDIPSKDIDIVFGNGNVGRVSTSASNDRAAALLQKETGGAQIERHVFDGEYHGFCNDLPRFITQIATLLN